jgi:hypothetical protein
MQDVQRIGDEILFRGELVAILVQRGTPATTMGDFTDALDDVHEHPDPCDCTHKIGCVNYRAETAGKNYDQSLDDIIDNIKPFVKGGLLRFADLERIVEQLKEELGKE